MKKLLFAILFLQFIPLYAQADTQYLINDWYLTNVEMKDGSKIFLRDANYLKNWGFKFEKKIYSFNDVQRLEERNGFPITYLLKQNEIITAPDSSLLIEKLTADSLILSQKIENMEDKDLFRYYLVPLKQVRQLRFEEVKGKDTLAASPILGPVFKNGLSKRNISTVDPEHPANTKENSNYRFNGELIFDINQKKVTFSIKDFEAQNKKEIEKKIEYLTTARNWNFTGAKDFKYATIPFSFVHYYKKSGKNETFGDVYTLYTSDYNDAFITEKIGLGDIEESNKYFDFAVLQYQKKNYKEAINLFEKSFQINKRNLNAYYNFAAMTYSTGNKEKACETYKFLKEEGQKAAEKEFNQKCLK